MRLALVCISIIALISPINTLQAETKSFIPSPKSDTFTTNFDTLETLLHTADPLPVVNIGKKTAYMQGEKLVLGIAVPQQGYLNVVSITETGETTLLFPNKYHKYNKVKAGNFFFPTAEMKFDLTAQAPFGKAYIVALLTNKAINLYQQDAKDVFKKLSPDEVKSLPKTFAVTPTDSAGDSKTKDKIKAGKLELMTCETPENCAL